MDSNSVLPTLTVAGIAAITATAGPSAAAETPPPGVEQLLPRGRIAAIFAPQFVAASEAVISDDAWILGVALDGEARAYSLNLLNRHEVVNDTIGDRNFAAVW